VNPPLAVGVVLLMCARRSAYIQRCAATFEYAHTPGCPERLLLLAATAPLWQQTSQLAVALPALPSSALSAVMTPQTTYFRSAVGTWVWLNAAASCLNCSRPSENSCLQQQYDITSNVSDTSSVASVLHLHRLICVRAMLFAGKTHVQQAKHHSTVKQMHMHPELPAVSSKPLTFWSATAAGSWLA
jgi:hypothetical protein